MNNKVLPLSVTGVLFFSAIAGMTASKWELKDNVQKQGDLIQSLSNVVNNPINYADAMPVPLQRPSFLSVPVATEKDIQALQLAIYAEAQQSGLSKSEQYESMMIVLHTVENLRKVLGQQNYFDTIHYPKQYSFVTDPKSVKSISQIPESSRNLSRKVVEDFLHGEIKGDAAKKAGSAAYYIVSSLFYDFSNRAGDFHRSLVYGKDPCGKLIGTEYGHVLIQVTDVSKCGKNRRKRIS